MATNSNFGKGMGGTASAGAATFNRDKAIEVLNDLLVVDHNALGLYDKVLEKLSNTSSYRNQVMTFRGDHERHIKDLTMAVQNLGGIAKQTTGPMGPIAKAITSVASAIMGDKGALQGLLQGEEYTTTSYNNVDLSLFPNDVQQIVMRNRQDEERHLAWVRETLRGL